MKFEVVQDFRDATMDNSGTRLLAHVRLCGCDMHLEAIEVEPTFSDTQSAADCNWSQMFDELTAAFGSDGPWDTVTIKGRKYALFAAPFANGTEHANGG